MLNLYCRHCPTQVICVSHGKCMSIPSVYTLLLYVWLTHEGKNMYTECAYDMVNIDNSIQFDNIVYLHRNIVFICLTHTFLSL